MRNFGNNSLQVSTDSNRSNSSASNDSFSVDGNTPNNTQSTTLNNHNHGRKRAHSGQTKAHPMAPDSTENTGKRKDVSGITRPDLQRSVPTFLSKLYNMVNDPASTDLIRWSPDGTSFIVERHEEFAAKVLPRFFKHNTFASFVRQLNMYDFHKVPHIMQGVLVSENEGEVWEFSNSNFQRDQPDLLLLVSRKRTRDRDEKDANSSDFTQLINDIASIKRHQTTISTDLRNLQRDNLILWEDNLAAREKHERHQDMIQKILRFLASVFSSNQIEMLSKQNDFILDGRRESGTGPDLLFNSPSHITPSPQNHTRSVNQDAIDLNLPALFQSAKSVSDSQISAAVAAVAGSKGPLTTSSVVAQALGATPYGHPSAKSPETYNTPSHQQHRSGNHSPALSSTEMDAVNNPDINISQQSSDLAAVAKSAESINDDIDNLQGHIETLASQLGFDPINLGDDIENADIAMFMNSHDDLLSGASYNDKVSLFDLADSPFLKDPIRQQIKASREAANEHAKNDKNSNLPTPSGKYNPRHWTPDTQEQRQMKNTTLTYLLDELSGLYKAMRVLKQPASVPDSSQYAWPSSFPSATAAPGYPSEVGTPSVPNSSVTPTPVIAAPFVPRPFPGMSPQSPAHAAANVSTGKPAPPVAPGMYEPTPSVVMPPGATPPGYPGYPYMGQLMYPGMPYYPMPHHAAAMTQPPITPTTMSTDDSSEPSSKRLRTDSPVTPSAIPAGPVGPTGTPPHPAAVPMGMPPYPHAYMPHHMMYGQMAASGHYNPYYASAYPPGYGYPSHPHPPHIPPGYPGMPTAPPPGTSSEPPSSGINTGKPNVTGSEAAE